MQHFRLFPFQEEAANKLRTAALQWMAKAAQIGAPRYGTTDIPFVGLLKAVTGAGKTPVLANVVSGLGDGLVLWTSKSSAVVEQTYNNLRDRYRSLLPEHVTILRQIPGQHAWNDIIRAKSGLTIWVVTTASWNEVESAHKTGAEDARLNLHRPQQDWAGGDSSPWDQLRNQLQRPLWIVSDESHNQTPTQLDQLADLGPIGFFMASATPVQNDLFDAWQKVLNREELWADLSFSSRVPVRTRDVVSVNLLKSTLEFIDYRSGSEESLDGTFAALQRVEAAAKNEGVNVTPRAIYVVERSNRVRGSVDEARPVVIWKHLRMIGVPADEIAIFTDTSAKDLPEEAEKVTSLSRLQPRHRHIIFNQSLQEGWDDPEAYVCYFDGATKSFVRIRQIVGRVLRQPGTQRFASEALNTAVLILNTPTDSYEQVLAELRAELRLYAPDDEPDSPPIRLKTRREPLPPISLKPQWRGRLRLPKWSLNAPDLKVPLRHLALTGERPWPSAALEAPGTGQRAIMLLAEERVARREYIDVLRSARTLNGVYLRRQIATRNRNALNALHSDSYMIGPAYEQYSCQGSLAQSNLTELAEEVVLYYEDHVEYESDPDVVNPEWEAGDHRPRTSEMLDFHYAAHHQYSRGNFNPDELLFAQALDNDRRGVWLRNGDSGVTSYSIPLPSKAGDSLRFYPDFLWWPKGSDGKCWALDTTGQHLLSVKIRGKLVTLSTPNIALIVRGRVDLNRETVVKDDVWSLVRGRGALAPIVEYAEELGDLLYLLEPLF